MGGAYNAPAVVNQKAAAQVDHKRGVSVPHDKTFKTTDFSNNQIRIIDCFQSDQFASSGEDSQTYTIEVADLSMAVPAVAEQRDELDAASPASPK